MTSPSALPAFIDTVVAVFDAAVDVTVLDGPQANFNLAKKDYVSVGWSGLDDAGGTVADIQQEWLYIGSLAKQEVAGLTCAAVSWSGGKDIKFQRDKVFSYVSDCEQALRVAIDTDTTLQALIRKCSLSVGSYDQEQLSDGVRCRVEFTVIYDAQI